MPESRDRLSRSQDVAVTFSRWRQVVHDLRVLTDEPETSVNLSGSQFRQGTTRMAATPRPVGMGALRGGGVGRGSFGTPRSGNGGRGRTLYGSSSVGRENTPATRRQGRGRPTNSVLPSWYPRTPLRDITAVVRAIERRRARLRETEGQQIESPIPLDQSVLDSSVSNSDAHLEHDISMFSPNPVVGIKPSQPSPSAGITIQTAGKSDFLTPQKKLLDSIEMVEKIFMEDLRKLKRTPTAKKAEREKKVRTLKSLR